MSEFLYVCYWLKYPFDIIDKDSYQHCVCIMSVYLQLFGVVADGVGLI